jgi:hypothetical protein
MKLMLRFAIPVEKGNEAAADGSLSIAINELKNAVKAESVYLFTENGERAGIVIFEESESARLPIINEPFFAAVDAAIDITPVVELKDLMKVI